MLQHFKKHELHIILMFSTNWKVYLILLIISYQNSGCQNKMGLKLKYVVDLLTDVADILELDIVEVLQDEGGDGCDDPDKQVCAG